VNATTPLPKSVHPIAAPRSLLARSVYRTPDFLPPFGVGQLSVTSLFGSDFMTLAQIATQATHTVTQTGIGLGSAIAVVCS